MSKELRTSVRIDRSGHGHTDLSIFTAFVPPGTPEDVTHARAGQITVTDEQAPLVIGRLHPVRVTAREDVRTPFNIGDLLDAANERRRLRADNARLREALEQIAGHPNAAFNVAVVKRGEPTIADVARSALSPQPPDPS